MKIKLSQSDFCLAKRQTLSLGDAAGVRIEARSGAVWVTQDHDLRDVVLQQGESFTIERNGRAIVQAFEASRISLTQPAAAPKARRTADWPARIASAVRRALPRPAWA